MEDISESSDDSNVQGHFQNFENPKDVAMQRMKEFCFYLIESIEKNLNFRLTFLEKQIYVKKTNSVPIKALSSLATPIPYIGKGLSSALQKGEIFLLHRIDKRNARIIADLVYSSNDKREAMRKLFIESSIDIFYCFEHQFVKLTCDGGPRRAMQKLAKDAANRIFTHFMKNKQSGAICKDDITKGVIFGDSLKNKVWAKLGKTVQDETEHKWKTSDIYSKVGLYSEDTGEFYRNEHTESEKFGYRRIFPWEDLEQWSKDHSSCISLCYSLKQEDLKKMYAEIREYIMKKNIKEEAELDREKKHEETMNGQEHLTQLILDNFAQVLHELVENFEEIIKNHKLHSQKILVKIKEHEDTQNEKHDVISEKLNEIHLNVLETKEGQVQLQQTTEDLKKEICIIKHQQEEVQKAVSTEILNYLIQNNKEAKKILEIVNVVKGGLYEDNAENAVSREPD